MKLWTLHHGSHDRNIATTVMMDIVSSDASSMSELFSTEMTFEREGLLMNKIVNEESTLLTEGFGAKFACKWLFTCVHQHMTLESHFATSKCHVADLVRPFAIDQTAIEIVFEQIFILARTQSLKRFKFSGTEL